MSSSAKRENIPEFKGAKEIDILVHKARNGRDGRDGLDGRNGIDGRDGIDGRNGTDGINGINGTNGINGANGKDGKDGKDGNNGTGAGISAPNPTIIDTVPRFADTTGSAVKESGISVNDSGDLFCTTILATDGTAALPALSFASASNMGIFRAVDGGLGFSINGSQVMEIKTDGTISASTANYSSLATTSDVLVNKQYVDTAITTAISGEGTITVANGGTGDTSLTAGNFLIGNGTNPVNTSKVAPSGVVVGTTDTQTLSNKTVLDGSTFFANTTDLTKQLQFNLSGLTTGTTRVYTFPDVSSAIVTDSATQTLTNKTLTNPIISSISNTGTLTLPTSTDTLVGRNTTDTLTNKTLTLPTIASINNGGTLTLPTGPGTLLSNNSSTTLLNKLLDDTTVFFVDPTDTTKQLGFLLSGAGSGFVMTLASNQTANRTLTLPDLTDFLVSRTSTDTLTNKTLTAPVIATINNSGTLTLPTSTDTLVGRATTDTLTNKTLTAPVIATIVNSGTLTLPTSTDTLVGRNTTDTLTNKTLTLPTISSINNGGTLTLPTGPGTLLSSTNAITLQNKFFDDTTDFFVDPTDTSKRGGFLLSGATTGTTILFVGVQTANRSLTLPDLTDTLVSRTSTDTLTNKTLTAPIIATIVNVGTLTLPTSSDTLVGRNTTDTLTNKTLTLPVIAAIVNTGTLTLPTSTDTLIGRNTTDLLTNKTLDDTKVFFVDPTDVTKVLGFLLSGATTGTSMTLASNQTANRVLTLPDLTDFLVSRTSTDTLTNKTLTAPVIATIVNSGTLTLPTSSDTLVGRNTTDTLTNKTLTLPTIASINNGGTLTLPTGPGTLLSSNSSATLLNKLLDDTTVFFVDHTDTTKQAGFLLSGAVTGTTIVLAGVQTANRTLTLPDLTDFLVSRTSTDTLTNKTLTAPVIATIVNSGTLTLPTSTDTLVARNTTDTLTNKSLSNSTTFFVDNTDATKRIQFQDSGATTGTLLTLAGVQTVNRTLTFPDATDVLVGRNTTDTLTNKTLTAPIISTIVNTGTLTLPTSTDTLVGRNTTDTLTNKTLTAPVISTIVNSGTLTLPTSTDTLVGRNTTDTLTNKTLTLPTIASINNGGTLTLPTGPGTLLSNNNSTTLTNKLFDDTTDFFVDPTDTTKQAGFLLSGATTGTSIKLAGVQTANRVLTLPDATDTLVARNTTDTLTNKTLTAPVIATIVNTGTLTLPTSTDTLVGRNTTDTLSNKSLVNSSNFFVDNTDNTKRIGFSSSGATTNTTLTIVDQQTTSQSLNVPNVSAGDTIVTVKTTQTITGTKGFTSIADLISQNSSTYSTGTASANGAGFINGIGTTFTQSMVGGIIVFNNGSFTYINGFVSTTSLIMYNVSLTVSNQAYTIYYNGLQADNYGNIGALGMNISGLNASQVVATDANKSLTSIVYDTAATTSTLVLRDSNANIFANNVVKNYTTTVTAAGTTTLFAYSSCYQYFTGSSTQTVVLPVTSTLALGFEFSIVNNSTGAVTVQSSGLNNILVLPQSTNATFRCISTSGTNSSSWSVISSVSNDSTPNTAISVAPYGLRDLWQYSANNTAGLSLVYDSTRGFLYTFGNNTNQIKYSTDGGVTFPNSASFTVAPGAALLLATNGSTVAAISLGTSKNFYASTDGINFTQGAVQPAASAGFNVVWFPLASLFIYYFGNGHIYTSPDGVTWTSRTTPTPAHVLAVSPTMVVALSNSSAAAMWSTDGITWTSASTNPSTSGWGACTWSAEKGEFFAIRQSGTGTTNSIDGINWSTTTSVSFSASTIIWVANGIDRYYTVAADSAGGDSIWTATSSSSGFVNSFLDGAQADGVGNGSTMVYLPTYNRLVAAVGISPYTVMYSTARNDIKALTDNIRVRGAPVTVCKYSTYANTTCNSTTTETDISTTASALGNLYFQKNQAIGTVIEFDLNALLSSSAGDTLSIRFKSTTGGTTTTLLTHTFTVPALSSNLPVNIHTRCTIQNGTIQMNSTRNMSNTPTITSTNPSYAYNAANTWTITAQWGAAVNTLTMNQLIVDAKFLNGA
jgi:hypothetical protein